MNVGRVPSEDSGNKSNIHVVVVNLLLSKQSKNSICLKGNSLFTCQPNLTRPNLQIIVTTPLSYTTRAAVNDDDIGW